jgi:outer membrane protein OmpA-like peptidoglycan-associated protein
VSELFPLRNYIFFEAGSTEIPNRYVLLKKDEVAAFEEQNVFLTTPANLSGSDKRQMIVYYNILNILGKRMNANPSTNIKLVGSSLQGASDGRSMAESVKNYLVNVFGISPSRITVEGNDKPSIPSTQPGQVNDLEMIQEGDRRVSIESNSPVLLDVYRSGPIVNDKATEKESVQKAPPESYVSVNVEGAEKLLTSWTLQVKDEDGKVQYFGPFTEEKVYIPGSDILGSKKEGDYKFTMMGKTSSDKQISKDTTVHMVLWKESANEEVMRFSIIYGFDDSKAIELYRDYLRDVVLPKIPKGGKVIIQGYTDIIGDTEYNHKLSHARATDVKNILEKELIRLGRTDVKFEVNGFGEDLSKVRFGNKYPEERFYNRGVTIDILPR